MLRQLVKRLFGPSIRPRPEVPHADPTVTNPDGSSERKPWRTVGLTEQRLREANRRSWHTSAKGWSEILGRFSRSGS
jgi:hypothetical protein